MSHWTMSPAFRVELEDNEYMELRSNPFYKHADRHEKHIKEADLFFYRYIQYILYGRMHFEVDESNVYLLRNKTFCFPLSSLTKEELCSIRILINDSKRVFGDIGTRLYRLTLSNSIYECVDQKGNGLHLPLDAAWTFLVAFHNMVIDMNTLGLLTLWDKRSKYNPVSYFGNNKPRMTVSQYCKLKYEHSRMQIVLLALYKNNIMRVITEHNTDAYSRWLDMMIEAKVVPLEAKESLLIEQQINLLLTIFISFHRKRLQCLYISVI